MFSFALRCLLLLTHPICFKCCSHVPASAPSLCTNLAPALTRVCTFTMPKLRRRHKLPADSNEQNDLKPTSSRMHSPHGHKRRKATAKHYQHFASASRKPKNSPYVDDFPEGDPPSFFLVQGLAAVTLLICFGASPDLTLRLCVLAETLIFAFPPYFSRWPVLIAILLPIRTKCLLEISVGLIVFSWASGLDWAYASGRIGI